MVELLQQATPEFMSDEEELDNGHWEVRHPTWQSAALNEALRLADEAREEAARGPKRYKRTFRVDSPNPSTRPAPSGIRPCPSAGLNPGLNDPAAYHPFYPDVHNDFNMYIYDFILLIANDKPHCAEKNEL